MRNYFLQIIIVLLIFVGCSPTKQASLTVPELLSLGEKHLGELDYEQAIVQFLKVIEIEPMNPRGYTGAAEAYIGLNQLDNAISVLEDGAKVLTDNIEISAMTSEVQALVEEQAKVSEEAELDEEELDEEEIESDENSQISELSEIANELETESESVSETLTEKSILDRMPDFEFCIEGKIILGETTIEEANIIYSSRADYNYMSDTGIWGLPNTDELRELRHAGYVITQEEGESVINFIQVENFDMFILDKYYIGGDASELFFDLTGMTDMEDGHHLMFYDNDNFFALYKGFLGAAGHGFYVYIKESDNYLVIHTVENIISSIQLGKKGTTAEYNAQSYIDKHFNLEK